MDIGKKSKKGTKNLVGESQSVTSKVSCDQVENITLNMTC